ncbi:hypothetical protein [Streptomyces sp. NRRL S-495]|uniref:hypothetical protein n=1 Tax=Streptomyces sp. NRRL S-495 TaxID=1609133 RepID=UPI0005F8F3F9|nr:hypothetical protein [Streptomyces sp. NRRL S-495]KJY36496.1 hypothetical protein VR45_11105 [Streptomyces sp. NRRL S-495]
MPFDVFAAIGAIVRAEATRTTEPAPSAPSGPSAPSAPSDPDATAHPAEPHPAPHPLQEPAAGPTPQLGTLPPATPLLPGLSA